MVATARVSIVCTSTSTIVLSTKGAWKALRCSSDQDQYFFVSHVQKLGYASWHSAKMTAPPAADGSWARGSRVVTSAAHG